MLRTFALLLLCLAPLSADPLRFAVTLDAALAPKGASGRLFVLLQQGTTEKKILSMEFLPGKMSLAAREVEYLGPGQSVELDPSEAAYPKALSQLPPGDYSAMALLDVDHSYALRREDAGDLASEVVALHALRPDRAGVVLLKLTRTLPPPAPLADTPNVKLVEMQSALLTAFMGRPVTMRAGVVLPEDWQTQTSALPVVYHVHGFGGDLGEAWQVAKKQIEEMKAGRRLRAVHVYLDANCPGGHHVFADSVNNGPWGKALTTEFVPYLESRYPISKKPAGRFLTGHSSGGWTTLWLQVAYPDFFGGTWPTSPDSVDFRSFTGIDATPGSTANAYRKADGSPLNLVRMNGKDVLSMEEFLRLETTTGAAGGQMASFEWVFSPRGADGRPMPLFNRISGDLDPVVIEAWKKYDIGRIVRENWETLGPKLLGKVRLTIGDADTFHLNESAKFFCDFMREKGREDACEIVPGRDHFNLYQPYETYKDGLRQRIDDEMRAKWAQAVN